MCGTKQVGVWSDRGPYDNYTAPQDQPAPQEGIGIDPELSRHNGTSAQILQPSSLDYRTCHGLHKV